MAPDAREKRITNIIRSFDQAHASPASAKLTEAAVAKFQTLKKLKFDRSGHWQALCSSIIQDVKIPGAPSATDRRKELAHFVRAVVDAAGGAGLSNAETSTLALNVYDVLAPVAVLRNDPYNEQAEARAAETAALTDLRRRFGALTKSAFDEMVASATRIYNWLSHTEAAGEESAEGHLIAGQEFGGRIRYQAGSTVAMHGTGDEEDAALMTLHAGAVGQAGAPDKADLVARYLAATPELEEEDSLPTEGEERQVGDTFWLRTRCERYLNESGVDIPLDVLVPTIFKILSTYSGAGAENELVEMLGFDSLDLVSDILEHRDLILDETLASLERVRADSPAGGINIGAMFRADDARPVHGAQVVIQTGEEKEWGKQARKQMRKAMEQQQRAARDDDSTSASDLLMALGLQRWREARATQLTNPLAARPALFKKSVRDVPVYPHVYDTQAHLRSVAAHLMGHTMMLPPNARRTMGDRNLYEEIEIPPMRAAPPRDTECRVPVTEFSQVAQMAFKGFTHLNRIQSIMFETAYKTNENILACAPTGAGKTNVALMTVVREIEQNIIDGVIQLDKFKIVYVAPMKALAAEMTDNFGKRLASLGVTVRELTGDMQLTKTEIKSTQMVVTTPEKWDVITRKGAGDSELAQLVRLLIIDEVHLLHDERGPVIESLVARTLRQVEASQSMIRIVGLSATLPNYVDVARFLNVNPFIGLFYFDGAFRPVPLAQTYVGVRGSNPMAKVEAMNEVCYEKVFQQIKAGHQVMVFVHSRKDTAKTAEMLREKAMLNVEDGYFSCIEMDGYGRALQQVEKSRNKAVRDLFEGGFSIHHAGMLRADRTLVERLFAEGLIRVLVCTATLAWGVNLPAHAVVIKGTNLYDARVGGFRDLGVLDVQQIFGRAGRPQFDTYGEAYLLTSHEKLSHYVALMTHQTPIESQFIKLLDNNLNAEIALGTVTNVDEAIQWLSYTYLFVRMRLNPTAYGITHAVLEQDPMLENKRRELIVSTAKKLDADKMIRFDERNGYLVSTDIGRTASHYYLNAGSIELYNAEFRDTMSEDHVFQLLSRFTEFENIQVRQEELPELDKLLKACVLPVRGGVENTHGKVNILLQSYISRQYVDAFSLVSDQAYVAQNAARVLRALFELSVRRHRPIASMLLTLSKCVDRRMWDYECPLRQLDNVKPEIITRLEEKQIGLAEIHEMDAGDIGGLLRNPRLGDVVKSLADHIPTLFLDAQAKPITRTVLRITVTIEAAFKWHDRHHGGVEPWWMVVEDPDNDWLHHAEYFMLHKKTYREAHTVVFTVPVMDPLPAQYILRAMSDRWLGSETTVPLSFQQLVLPDLQPPHTPLLDLTPLPVTALRNRGYQTMFNFTHFNPVQTQFFHALYHTDTNVLVGAPTGSGKTVAAELAMFRVFNEHPGKKVVYVAPLKALVRERMDNWEKRLVPNTGKRLVELTGETAPDIRAIQSADVIVTTPEKWDGVSRSWQTRSYVQHVALIIMDEIHMLEADRGPVLEVIVSRTNYISAHTNQKIRLVGMSTALANAHDLGRWLGIASPMGLYNFRPSVRPVPLEVHIDGFSGKHYCPRMATMNKPAYQAIRTHSPTKPVLVFVSSRRQTRLTALDLISKAVADENPKQWLHIGEEELEGYAGQIRDPNLRHTLAFGIGLHHAGLHPDDRRVVEQLFEQMKIQVLVATSTLAWGVNLPAHLVIVKGTEYYDGKTKRYEDMAVTDVLQMMGRAGRPQYDDSAVAVILVQDVKKDFYKKFLYEPFPVESKLPGVLHDHLNAEIAAGTIASRQDAVEYLTWTYFFHRLTQNPSYYGLEGIQQSDVNVYLSEVVETVLSALHENACCTVDDDTGEVASTFLGQIASYYYLMYGTVGMFSTALDAPRTVEELLAIMTDAHEYDELPVRHNEELTNAELAKSCMWAEGFPESSMDSPNTKASLLLQTHFARGDLPISDYVTDTKSVLDQAVRILQAMVDISAEFGYADTTINAVRLLQMVYQGRWDTDSPFLMLPHVDAQHVSVFGSQSLRDAMRATHTPKAKDALAQRLRDRFTPRHADEIMTVLLALPMLEVQTKVVPGAPGNAIRPGDECAIEVHLHIKNQGKEDDDAAELMALTRVTGGRSGATLSVQIPDDLITRATEFVLTLYVLSANYLGLDQSVKVRVPLA